MRTAKLCVDCGKRTTETRCQSCRGPSPYSNREYRKRRALLIADCRERIGIGRCPGILDIHDPHPLIDGNVLTIDHVVPLKDGGTHDEENLRVVCRSWNSARR